METKSVQRVFRALVLSLLLTISAHAAVTKPIDIVFDLDDTLIRWIRPGEKVPTALLPLSGEINGYRYRILDGAPEIVQHYVNLAKSQGARVSFFSLGDEDRNLKVLKLFKLPNGQTAFEIAYKILSDKDAVTLNGLHLKDLTLVNPDLSRVFLVDDRFVTTVPGQEQNVVHILPKVPHFFSSVEERWQDGDNQVHQTTPRDFFQNRNKLAFGVAIIDRALSNAGHQTPLEALTQVQYLKGAYRDNLVDDIRFYREGARIFHEVDDRYAFTSIFGKQTPQMLRQRCELLLLSE
jgi:hypothetical protein